MAVKDSYLRAIATSIKSLASGLNQVQRQSPNFAARVGTIYEDYIQSSISIDDRDVVLGTALPRELFSLKRDNFFDVEIKELEEIAKTLDSSSKLSLSDSQKLRQRLEAVSNRSFVCNYFLLFRGIETRLESVISSAFEVFFERQARSCFQPDSCWKYNGAERAHEIYLMFLGEIQRVNNKSLERVYGCELNQKKLTHFRVPYDSYCLKLRAQKLGMAYAASESESHSDANSFLDKSWEIVIAELERQMIRRAQLIQCGDEADLDKQRKSYAEIREMFACYDANYELSRKMNCMTGAIFALTIISVVAAIVSIAVDVL